MKEVYKFRMMIVTLFMAHRANLRKNGNIAD